MAVSFVIGRAGGGKTRRCFDSIVAALRADPVGPAVYWVVPKQATFLAERELTCAGGLNGFCRARVVSFESLGEEVLADRGGAAVPAVTPLGRQMILGHLLRQRRGDLRFFADVAGQSGLAAKLDATFSEFERGGRSADDLRALIDALDAPGAPGPSPASGGNPQEAAAARVPRGSALRNKLHDLHLIYDAYTAFLGQDRLDQHRRLLQVLKSIEDSPLLRNATVYVDGFHSFSEYERRILARLGRACRHVEIALLMGPGSPLLADWHLLPGELSLFHPVETTYRRLRLTLQQEGVAVDLPLTLLPDVKRFKTPALNAVEADLFKEALPSRADPAGVELAEAPARRAEVDAAARRIRDYLAEGLRYRDIALLVRDLDDYHDLIDAGFREHGIPFFADRRRKTAHHPLLQFVRGALVLAAHPWPHDGMMDFLKCGLADLDPDAADELENYVLTHRIRGAAWASPAAWGFRRRCQDEAGEADTSPLPGDEIEAVRADLLRRQVVDRLLPFLDLFREGMPLPVRQIAGGMFGLFERFGVRREMGRWIEELRSAGDLERAAEHEQVWAGIGELLDQMVDLLGDEPLSLADFQEVIELGLEQFDLAITPPTVDQVLVGAADRTRTPEVRAVMVLGFNEGVFPRAPAEDSVLSDADRRELKAREVEIDADAKRRLLDERLLGYLAVTRASERLYVSRSLSDGAGRALGESDFWLRLRRMFPTLEPRRAASENDAGPLAGTPRQLVTSLMRWAREAAKTAKDANGAKDAVSANGANSTTGANITSGARVTPAAPGAPSPTLPLAEREPGGSAAGRSADGTTFESPFPALYHWFATSIAAGTLPAPLAGAARAWGALSYRNAARLSPEAARALFPSPLTASVSRLETFAACPFRHFLRYGLELRGRQAEHVSALDLSAVFHGALEGLVAEMLRQNKTWADLGDAQRRDLIRVYARETGQRLRGEILLSNARNVYLLGWIERTLDLVAANQKAVAERGRFRPAAVGHSFGSAGDAPAPLLPTPAGHALRLQGRIDRLDVIDAPAPGAPAAYVVIDYRLGGAKLDLAYVYHGLSLQLLASLLALESGGDPPHGLPGLEGKRLAPAAAFYVRLLRRLGEVNHPSEAIGPDDPLFHLGVKPRGLFDGAYLHALDTTLTAGTSKVVHASLSKSGPGAKGRSDLADAGEFAALLAHVRRKLGGLADGIVAGEVAIRPYLIRQTSPCPTCDYRSVCRFELPGNRYVVLGGMKREEVLRRVAEESRDSDGEAV